MRICPFLESKCTKNKLQFTDTVKRRGVKVKIVIVQYIMMCAYAVHYITLC